MRSKIHRMPGVLPGRTPINNPPPRRSGKVGLGLILIGGLAGLYWYFFYGPTFMVQSVEVVGSDHASLRSIGDKLVGSNIFRVNPAALEQDMRQVYPSVDSVEVIRGLPKVIRLVVKLRDPALQWQVGETVYVLDNNGEVFAEGEKPEYTSLPRVIDTSGKKLEVGQQVATTAFIQMIQEIRQHLPDHLQRNYTTIEITETTFHIDVILEGGIRIRLTTQRPAEEQLDSAKLILAHHPEAKVVDVRIAQWGYWK